MDKGFIPNHGRYKKLLVYHLSQIIYDYTTRFCNKFIYLKSRTHDQMIQAARSGMQNIVEGSVDSAVSKESEIKLTGIARGSLHELKSDYEAYLRQHGYEQWEYGHPFALELFRKRFQTASEVIRWVGSHKDYPADSFGANTAIVFINITLNLLNKLITSQEKDFLENGGIKERMLHSRLQHRCNRQV